MKSLITLVLLFTSTFIFSQDRILKTDGTVIKGKVVSFQNNRLTVMQEDETEIVLPKKAIAEIRFDYQDNIKVTSKSVETPQNTPLAVVNAPASYSQPVVVEETKHSSTPSVSENIKSETAKQKEITTTPINNNVESAGEVTGFTGRTLTSAAPLKQRPVGAGRVAVNVCVNADGIVTLAKFKPVGSSTMDTDLISLAVQNAREYRFSKGKSEDCGIVVYKFNLN